MAKLCKKVALLVSCKCDHGEDGWKFGSPVFFRSMEEYERLSKENEWENEKTYGKSWYRKPIEIDSLVDQKAYFQFMEHNKALHHDKVFFSANIMGEVISLLK